VPVALILAPAAVLIWLALSLDAAGLAGSLTVRSTPSTVPTTDVVFQANVGAALSTCKVADSAGSMS
jgi:hypothetical protein